MRHLVTIITQVCTGLCIFMALEGHAWIDSGFGIHPMAAGAMAVVFFIIPHFIARYYYE